MKWAIPSLVRKSLAGYESSNAPGEPTGGRLPSGGRVAVSPAKAQARTAAGANIRRIDLLWGHVGLPQALAPGAATAMAPLGHRPPFGIPTRQRILVAPLGTSLKDTVPAPRSGSVPTAASSECSREPPGLTMEPARDVKSRGAYRVPVARTPIIPIPTLVIVAAVAPIRGATVTTASCQLSHRSRRIGATRRAGTQAT